MASFAVPLVPSLVFFFVPAPRPHSLAWSPGFAPPPAGNGFSDTYTPLVHALHVHDDGSGPALYAGGRFVLAGGSTVRNIARWDGAQWSALGNPADLLPNAAVYTLAT